MTQQQQPAEGDTFEIRRDEEGALDEVVADRPRFFHMERMDLNEWWIGVDMDDGRRIRIAFTTKGKSEPYVEVE